MLPAPSARWPPENAQDGGPSPISKRPGRPRSCARRPLRPRFWRASSAASARCSSGQLGEGHRERLGQVQLGPARRGPARRRRARPAWRRDAAHFGLTIQLSDQRVNIRPGRPSHEGGRAAPPRPTNRGGTTEHEGNHAVPRRRRAGWQGIHTETCWRASSRNRTVRCRTVPETRCGVRRFARIRVNEPSPGIRRGE